LQWRHGFFASYEAFENLEHHIETMKKEGSAIPPEDGENILPLNK